MRRFFCIAMTVLMLLSLACSTATANTYTTDGAAAPGVQTGEQTGEQTTEQQPAQPAQNETTTTEEGTMNNPIATITMKDGGVMKLELYPDVAPNTVKNFISLANSGFYDGLTFHRVIAGFMIQGGDPDGVGTGGPGYSIKGEFTGNGFENNLAHKRGVISMARAQNPDSAGSQFFIMHVDYPYLDGQYASFGMMTEGFTVLDKIATVQTDRNDKPVNPVVIDTIRVETFGVDYGEPEIIK